MSQEDRERQQQIGAEWEHNSSLEKWFPLTAEKIKRLERELAAAQKNEERYRNEVEAYRLSVNLPELTAQRLLDGVGRGLIGKELLEYARTGRCDAEEKP